MAEQTQNLKNHRRTFPAYHFFVAPVLFLNVLNALWHIWLAPGASTIWAAIVAAALLGLAGVARIQALTVQNRVIRLEMRLRLRDLLPADLRPRIPELTTAQLVALRFAGDAELPELTREVLAGRLPSSNAIKARIADWQADWLRA